MCQGSPLTADTPRSVLNNLEYWVGKKVTKSSLPQHVGMENHDPTCKSRISVIITIQVSMNMCPWTVSLKIWIIDSVVHSWICPTNIYWQQRQQVLCHPLQIYRLPGTNTGGLEIQIQIFCGLIPQIKLVNHRSTSEERTPATRVITNTAAYTAYTDHWH